MHQQKLVGRHRQISPVTSALDAVDPKASVLYNFHIYDKFYVAYTATSPPKNYPKVQILLVYLLHTATQ